VFEALGYHRRCRHEIGATRLQSALAARTDAGFIAFRPSGRQRRSRADPHELFLFREMREYLRKGAATRQSADFPTFIPHAFLLRETVAI
jgi:hypothetical protein